MEYDIVPTENIINDMNNTPAVSSKMSSKLIFVSTAVCTGYWCKPLWSSMYAIKTEILDR